MATGWQAEDFPTFQPAQRFVIGITNAKPASVTTSLDGENAGAHDYKTGMVVRLLVPPEFGMSQVNQVKGTITVTGETTFTIDIDTRNLDTFVVPAVPYQFAQVIPIGEVNSTLYAATQNVLPSGVF